MFTEQPQLKPERKCEVYIIPTEQDMSANSDPRNVRDGLRGISS